MLDNNDFDSKYAASTADSYLVMAFLHEVMGQDVTDLTYDAEAQLAGVDFLVNGKTVEFKSDTKIHRTGNLAYEIMTNSKPGAAIHSTAEYLLYYDPASQICHKLKFQKLKKAIERSPQTVWKVAKSVTSHRGSPISYCNFSLLVPLAWIKGQESLEYQSFSVAEYAATYQPLVSLSEIHAA